MKKLLCFLSLTTLLTACEKEKDDTIDKALLLGNWERININMYNSCVEYKEFHEDFYRYSEICGSQSSYGSQSYTLDGNDIIVNENVVWEIIYLAPTLLKMKYLDGTIQEYRKPDHWVY